MGFKVVLITTENYIAANAAGAVVDVIGLLFWQHPRSNSIRSSMLVHSGFLLRLADQLQDLVCEFIPTIDYPIVAIANYRMIRNNRPKSNRPSPEVK